VQISEASTENYERSEGNNVSVEIVRDRDVSPFALRFEGIFLFSSPKLFPLRVSQKRVQVSARSCDSKDSSSEPKLGYDFSLAAAVFIFRLPSRPLVSKGNFFRDCAVRVSANEFVNRAYVASLSTRRDFLAAVQPGRLFFGILSQKWKLERNSQRKSRSGVNVTFCAQYRTLLCGFNWRDCLRSGMDIPLAHLTNEQPNACTARNGEVTRAE